MWKGLWRRWGTIPVLPANDNGQAAWVCTAKGCRGRPQSPRLAPAGAIPPAAMKIKPHGCALRRGVGGDRRLRLFSLPPPRLRRGEIPCLRKRPATSERQAVRSRPFGATQHSWSNEQLGGASEDARSYWQGRFAACALLAASLELSVRGTVGALPQTPPEALPLDSARGNCPLTPFRD